MRRSTLAPVSTRNVPSVNATRPKRRTGGRSLLSSPNRSHRLPSRLEPMSRWTCHPPRDSSIPIELPPEFATPLGVPLPFSRNADPRPGKPGRCSPARFTHRCSATRLGGPATALAWFPGKKFPGKASSKLHKSSLADPLPRFRGPVPGGSPIPLWARDGIDSTTAGGLSPGVRILYFLRSGSFRS